MGPLAGNFLNHRYADLSILHNFLNKNQDEENDFLKKYLGREPEKFDSACFYLLQQVLHLNYFTVFMVVIASKGREIDWKKITEFDFRDFHNRMWNGEITLFEDETRLQYAILHKKQLEKNIRSERYKETLAFVSKFLN